MHLIRRIAVVAIVIALILAGSGSAISGALARSAHAESPITGHVYVNDNVGPINTIAAFDRHADGSLSVMDGSPFVAGGAGAAVASQGALQLSVDGRYLLAADAGSNQISVLRLTDDGALRPVHGSPFWSGGIQPVTIAVHDSLVFVGNNGNGEGGANYTGFLLSPAGRLTPIPGSTYSLPSPTTIGDVLFNGDGTRLVGTRVDSSLIDSFTVANGQLTAAPGSPFEAQGYGPFGSRFRPTNPDQLYVSNAHNATGGPAPGTVSAFGVGADGTLSSIGASPYGTDQIAACWVEIAHNGQYLFAVNTGSNSVSSFSIASNGSLALIGSTALSGSLANLGALDAGIDPTDHFLYVVERGANAVAGLRVNADGSLTELPSSPSSFPSGSGALGIVVD